MEEKRVACEKCIKAYGLDESLLGKDKEKCFWCCSTIWERKKDEFDVKEIYWKEKTPKEIAKWIKRLTDKKLQFIILPTSKKKCDILIRDALEY